MNKQEIEKKLRLLLRSVYLKGQMDKTTDLSWEDKIIEDIFALLQAGEKKHHIPFSERIGYSSPEKEQAGDNIGRCKACGNVLQKEGCPACHEKEQARMGINKINICRTIYEMLQYLPNGIEGEKDIEAIADAILALSHPPSPCRECENCDWRDLPKLRAEIKRYREVLEKIAKNECGWCSARYKAKTALATEKEER